MTFQLILTAQKLEYDIWDFQNPRRTPFCEKSKEHRKSEREDKIMPLIVATIFCLEQQSFLLSGDKK